MVKPAAKRAVVTYMISTTIVSSGGRVIWSDYNHVAIASAVGDRRTHSCANGAANWRRSDHGLATAALASWCAEKGIVSMPGGVVQLAS